MKTKYAIIVAGGSGLRMGTDIPKQFLLLKGKPVLMYSLEAFYEYDSSIKIIVVLPESQKKYWHSLCKQYKCKIKHAVADGGATRFHSVKNGLALVAEDSFVAIHDGVRPLITPALIAELFEKAERGRAAYPVIPVVDTLHRLTPNGNAKAVDRSKFLLVQTPQVFWSKTLLFSYNQEYDEKFTDDISVVETRKICKPVRVNGHRENLKITVPTDLLIAEAILNGR
jgi:2-C-methyl-D-erythritol 4-phosphate cytidylyltransferase